MIYYIITPLGAKELQLPLNTTYQTTKHNQLNSKYWQICPLFNIIEEKIDKLDSDYLIKRNTNWIAIESNNPIINTINGPYINKGCHIMPSYHIGFINIYK